MNYIQNNIKKSQNLNELARFLLSLSLSLSLLVCKYLYLFSLCEKKTPVIKPMLEIDTISVYLRSPNVVWQRFISGVFLYINCKEDIHYEEA